MDKSISRRTAPHIVVVGGQPTTTSRDIAGTFGKRHDHVLDRIRKLDCSPEFNAPNFRAVEYTDAKGEKRTEYRITRDGFAFLCMGFTGARAAQWKERYINTFNKLAEKLASKAQPLPRIKSTPVALPAPASTGPSVKQCEAALQAGGLASLQVQMALARAVLDGGNDWQHQRWLISFITDSERGMPPVVERLPLDAFVGTVPELCTAILSGDITGRDFIDLAYAVNQHQYKIACNNKNRGYGDEVAAKFSDMSWSDLHTINVRSSMEVWTRSQIPTKEVVL